MSNKKKGDKKAKKTPMPKSTEGINQGFVDREARKLLLEDIVEFWKFMLYSQIFGIMSRAWKAYLKGEDMPVNTIRAQLEHIEKTVDDELLVKVKDFSDELSRQILG